MKKIVSLVYNTGIGHIGFFGIDRVAIVSKNGSYCEGKPVFIESWDIINFQLRTTARQLPILEIATCGAGNPFEIGEVGENISPEELTSWMTEINKQYSLKTRERKVINAHEEFITDLPLSSEEKQNLHEAGIYKMSQLIEATVEKLEQARVATEGILQIRAQSLRSIRKFEDAILRNGD